MKSKPLKVDGACSWHSLQLVLPCPRTCGGMTYSGFPPGFVIMLRVEFGCLNSSRESILLEFWWHDAQSEAVEPI
jgi:hypothetical protein